MQMVINLSESSLNDIVVDNNVSLARLENFEKFAEYLKTLNLESDFLTKFLLQEENADIEKYKAKEAAGEADRILFGAHEVNGLKVITATIPDADGNKLRTMGDGLRDKAGNVVAVLASVNGEKITFVSVCGKDAVAKGVKAGDIIRHVTAICGGKGGGKPDSAMGGGTDVLKLDDALASVDNFVFEKTK